MLNQVKQNIKRFSLAGLDEDEYELLNMLTPPKHTAGFQLSRRNSLEMPPLQHDLAPPPSAHRKSIFDV